MTAIAPADHAAYLDWLRAQLDQAIIPLDDAAWNRAAAQDSIDSYRAYLADFPSGRHSGDAKEVSRRLEADIGAWVKAITANCRTGFEGYLAAESNGKYCAEARRLLYRLVQYDQHAWVEAKKHGTLLAYRDYLTAFPEALHREDAYVQAWGIASKRDSLSGYKDYLSWFPQAPSRTLAQQASTRLQRDQTAWDCATNTNTIAAYNAYLETPTAGKFHAKAKAARDHLVSIDETNWQEIDGRLSLRAYRDYLKTCPEALHRTEAIDQAWASAKKTDSASAYRNFVAWFPNASQQALAQQVATALQSDHSAYKTATRQNTIAAFEAYLRTQAEGRFRIEAQTTLDCLVADDSAAWKRAAAQHTRLGYRAYLKAQPQGRFCERANAAIGELDDTDWARASKQESLQGYTAYLYASPNGRHRDEAIQMRDQQLANLQEAHRNPKPEPGRLRNIFRRLNLALIGQRPDLTIRVGKHPVTDVAITPDGKCALSLDGAGQIKVWDIDNRCLIREVSDNSTYWLHLVLGDVAGHRVLSGMPGYRLRLWDIETGETIREFSGHLSWVWKCVVSPDARHALTCSHDQTLRLWDLESSKAVQVFETNSEKSFPIGLSLNGEEALAIDYIPKENRYHILRFWSIETGEQIRSHNLGDYDFYSFTPCGCYTVLSMRDPKFGRFTWLHNLETNKPFYTVGPHEDQIRGVAVMPDRLHVLVASQRTLRLWSISANKEKARFKFAISGRTRRVGISKFVISQNGSHCLSANYDGTISLWVMPT